MAYIGREPQTGNYQICDAISVVDGQAAYTMQVSSTNVIPESVNHMIVSLNGVIQKPGSSYTIASSTITFSSNLATGDSIDFIYLLGNVLDLGTPSDSTVTTAKLSGNLVTPGTLDVNGQELILDADADTSITADTDDQIDIKVAGADDFQITANTLTALSGSTIKADTIAETTSANGVAVDGLTIKDGKLNTNDSVVTANITDANVTTAKITDANVTTAKIADDAITLAKMASGTDGNLISYDTSGNPVAVATGSSGQILTSAGAGAVPSFQDAAGGGILLATYHTVDTASRAYSGTSSYSKASNTLDITLTPASTSSKIHLLYVGQLNSTVAGRQPEFSFFRDSTNLADPTMVQDIDSSVTTGLPTSVQFLDTPNTTSSITYSCQIKGQSGESVTIKFSRFHIWEYAS